MNQALIDNSLLTIAFVTAIIIVKTARKRSMKPFPSFMLLFSPLVVFYNMWGHTVAVSIVNYNRFVEGTFLYDFRFYALMLFGIVFILISGINIDRARKAIAGDESQKRLIHWLNATTGLLFLPMFFINPIALLPVIASIISSATLATANFQNEKVSHAEVEVSSV
jgi:hypothetical protein